MCAQKLSFYMHPLIARLLDFFQGRDVHDVTQDYERAFSLARGSFVARFFASSAGVPLDAEFIQGLVSLMRDNCDNQLSPTYLYGSLRYKHI